ncbi:MAG: flagellar export protein FliJ, partial [Brevinema sp.]
MKKFQFRMQRILDIREKLELEQKNKLAKVAAEYQKVLLKKDHSLEQMQQARNKIHTDMQNNKISIRSLQYMDQLQNHTDRLVRSLAPEIQQKQQIMEKEREKYNKLHRDTKLIENLKKKELEKHKILQQRSESAVMDEIAKNFSHDLSSFYEDNNS